MKKRVLIGLVVGLALLAVGALAASASDGSVTIWQIGEFEPSADGYSVDEQVDEFWNAVVNYEYTFTIDPLVVAQDAGLFPKGLRYPGSVTIEFDVEEEGFYAFRYARFGSETDNIMLDGVLIGTVTGFANGPGSDFETVLYLSPIGSPHTLKIEVVGGSGDNEAHWFDALALGFVNAITVNQLIETYQPDHVFGSVNTDETIGELSLDCGVLYSSSIFTTNPGTQKINIYLWNLGPGDISFPASPFSDRYTPANKGVDASFDDLGWGGTFAEDVDFLGWVEFSEVTLWHHMMNAHLHLSVLRDGTPCTLGINVHFRP